MITIYTNPEWMAWAIVPMPVVGAVSLALAVVVSILALIGSRR